MKKVFIGTMIFALACAGGAMTSKPTPEEVKALTQKVADWQIETFERSGEYRALAARSAAQVKKSGTFPRKYHDLTWHMGALYVGMNEWRTIADNPEKYTDWLRMIGERNGWKLYKRPYHADDHTVGQFYLSLSEDTNDPSLLAPTQKRFDWILANPKTGSLEWSGYGKNKHRTDCHNRWGWCDALFMAPPVWARLAKITGEQKYLDFMDQEYHATYDLLWDQEDKLFWRDSSYFPKREKNGRKLYWARGNGWVFGGLALMIPDLPENWEGRDFYIDLYKEMANSLKNCQRADGTWSMGLLGGVEGYPIKETSGTSFYTFGLAWGLNNGLLDRATYEPIVLKAWQALSECVTDEGLLGYVQPVGAAPGDSYADKTEVYGIGAFLAAGTEVYKLVGGNVKPLEAGNSKIITFMKDGGWCWYQDPRSIIKNGKLIVAGLSGQSGDVKISVYDLKAGKDLGTVVLHEKFQRDDHDVPALYARPDGSILAVYAKHGNEKMHHYRISDPVDYLQWGEKQRFVHDYSGRSGVTYINLYTMKREGLLYNFFRDGQTWNPSFITSADHGETWGNRTRFILDEVEGRNRPYVRYLQRDPNTIGFSFTEAHPRDFGNSIYYADFRNGAFYNADGTKIKDLADGPLVPAEAERIFQGGGTRRSGKGASAPRSAWTCAMASDVESNPHIGYTLYLSNSDHRYRIASWNGKNWIDREVAYGGKCLYNKETSYTGLIALDPADPTQVVISTDVDPTTGKDLGGTHEIYVGNVGVDKGTSSIDWKPVTTGSEHRNIRPIIVSGEGYKVLLWLSGPWSTFRDYYSDVVGLVMEGPHK
ncbi:MAG: glycoside hydrolase family 88 protein [Kiritimatiellaceae bacterium]|nr:glycoside hydrolase family 88 protein [Kiritimatiellaceae bacterium]